MMGWITKLFGGGSIMLWALLALLASTTALGYTAKHYYDKSAAAKIKHEELVTAFEHTSDVLNEAIRAQTARYESLQTAFKKQQEDYTVIRQQAGKMRKQINELKKHSPAVSEYLDTPIPDDLYLQLFPDGGD